VVLDMVGAAAFRARSRRLIGDFAITLHLDSLQASRSKFNGTI
jgi:hypothetical protein